MTPEPKTQPAKKTPAKKAPAKKAVAKAQPATKCWRCGDVLPCRFGHAAR